MLIVYLHILLSFSELQERITELDNSNSKKYDEIKALESNLGLAKAESRQYQSELAVINQLFSEIILGFNNSQNINLDKLREELENHHDLLQEIVSNEISSEVSSALPKVLLDLLNEVNTNKEDDSNDDKVQTAETNQDEDGTYSFENGLKKSLLLSFFSNLVISAVSCIISQKWLFIPCKIADNR